MKVSDLHDSNPSRFDGVQDLGELSNLNEVCNIIIVILSIDDRAEFEYYSLIALCIT